MYYFVQCFQRHCFFFIRVLKTVAFQLKLREFVIYNIVGTDYEVKTNGFSSVT